MFWPGLGEPGSVRRNQAVRVDESCWIVEASMAIDWPDGAAPRLSQAGNRVSLDTAGPMPRTGTDAAVMLGGMVGVDPLDPATADSESHLPPGNDYTPLLELIGDARLVLLG